VNDGFAAYDMDSAAKSLYEFLWSEFADWYVELAKPRLRTDERPHVQYMLWHVLETSMRLLHPIMPFITEEIWQSLTHRGESIMVAPFPEADEKCFDESAEAQMDLLINAIRSIRNLRAEIGLQAQKVDACIVASGDVAALVSENADSIRNLARVGKLTVQSEAPADKGQCLAAHLPELEILVPVAGLIDVKQEVQKVGQEIAELDKELTRVRAKLSNEQFLSKAPPEIVEKERRIEAELAEKRGKLEERRKVFGE
jgi:valyl-tRNA synthetase